MDDTEELRRKLVAEQQVQSRADLVAKYGEVYDTKELTDAYEVISFAAPFCVVRRRSDGRKGYFEFQHSPRLYYNFLAAS